MKPLSFSMDDQHKDPSCHHVTTLCTECEADHGLCCICTQPGMRAHHNEFMRAVKVAQALPDLFGSPETWHKALLTSAHLDLPDIVFPTLAPSPLAPAFYPDCSISFSPRLAGIGNGINSNLVNTSLYGGGEANPSLPTLSGQRVLDVCSGTDSLRGVGLSWAGHTSKAKPPYSLPPFPPLSGAYPPRAVAAHPNAGVGRNPMSQRHSVPTSGAATPAAPRVKKCHHSSPCWLCQLNMKCCVCLDKLTCGPTRIRGGAPALGSPSDDSNNNFDDADDSSSTSSGSDDDNCTFRAPIPGLEDTPRGEAASRDAMEALEEEEFWQRRPDVLWTSLSSSPVPSLSTGSPSKDKGQVPTSQPHAELPLPMPSAGGSHATPVPTSQPSVETGLQAPPCTPAPPRTALPPYPPARSRRVSRTQSHHTSCVRSERGRSRDRHKDNTIPKLHSDRRAHV